MLFVFVFGKMLIEIKGKKLRDIKLGMYNCIFVFIILWYFWLVIDRFFDEILVYMFLIK